MSYYALGLGIGFLAAAIFVLFFFLFRRKTGGSAFEKYDERQLAIRGKAYQAGFFTLLLSLCLVSILDAMEIHWCEAPVDKFYCMFLSVTVFACTVILKDAYFGLGEKKKSLLLLFAAVAVIQFATTFSSLQEGTLIVDGLLTLKGVSPACGMLCVVILLTVLIQHFRSAGKTEEEE